MDLTQITQITEKLVRDGVLDDASLKYFEADAEIVAIGCTPAVAKIIGDTLPVDRTLLKRTLLIEHGKPDITTYVKYVRVVSPHPVLDGMKITAYPSHTKPSVRKLTHAEGLVLGKSDHIEPVVNEILKQTRQCVWLLDAATKYEPALKQQAHLRVRSVDGSDRNFASDLKTAVQSRKLAAVKTSVMKALQYELEDLPLAIAKQRIEDFYLLEHPQIIGRISPDIVAKSVEVRKRLADGIKAVEDETLDRLSTEVLSKPFLRKKKRLSRERAILENHDTAVMALISDAMTALNLIGEDVNSDVLEEIMKAYADLLSDLQDIDPNFVDSSPELTPPSPPSVSVDSGFTIPDRYSISTSALERMVWLASIGYVGEVATRLGSEGGAATAVFEGAMAVFEGAAAVFTVGGSATGGTLAIGGGTLVGGGFVGSGSLLAGGTVLCEAAGVIGGMSSGGIAGGKIGSLIPVPGAGTLVGAGAGLVIGAGIGAIRHGKSVKTAKKSFREQAAKARESLLEDFDVARQNLIATNQVTATADVSTSTTDLDTRLNAFRDKIAKKFKREKRDVASLSVTELTDRLTRYTAYLDQLGQDC